MGNLTRLIDTLAICVTIHNVGDKPTVIMYTTFISNVVSRIQRIDRQPGKTTLYLLYTVANPAPRGLLNREMYTDRLFLSSCTRYVRMVNTFSRV